MLFQHNKYLNSANEKETKGKFQFRQFTTIYHDMIGTSINNLGLMCKM